MGDEDHIEVGGDVPREIGGPGDGVVLVGRTGHENILGGARLDMVSDQARLQH